MSDSRDKPLIVYTFGPAWGIPVPTPSPFGLKLITWLHMHGVPHEVRVENNPGKGPKKKCPWAEMDGQLIGDSEAVMEAVRARRGIAIDEGLTPEQRGVATTTRLMLEEHYHQVWENELFIHEGGWKRGIEFFDQLPPVLRVLVRTMVRKQLRTQLWARGVGRHDHARIVEMGKADLDAVDALLGDKPFFLGDEPTEIDATVFAFMALTQWTPVESPLWDHYRSLPRLGKYCDRVLARYFT